MKQVFIFFLCVYLFTAGSVYAADSATSIPLPAIRSDLTQAGKGHLERLLFEQELGDFRPTNFIKYAIRFAVVYGVPANTIVLLLLLPAVAALIAAARHLVGIRGFGIFLPAALSVTFVATGPLVGIGLFIVIVAISTTARFFLRKIKIRLQYLPRMAVILWGVSVGILSIIFLAPFFSVSGIPNVSIFAVLILVLLSEEITRVQLGKSIKIALDLGVETLILALISYTVLSLGSVQDFALLNPEMMLAGTLVFDIVLGKYAGLRLRELWRFRKLINGK